MPNIIVPSTPQTITLLTTNQAIVTLTDAEIKASPSGLIAAIPAPGAGKAIMLIGAIYVWTIKPGGAYSNVNDIAKINLQYGDTVNQLSNSNLLSTIIAPQNGINVDIDQVWLTSPFLERIVATSAIITEDTARADIENQPAMIYVYNAGDGNFTGGDPANSLKVIVYFFEADL